MTHDDETRVREALKAMDRRSAGLAGDDEVLERLHATIMARADLVLRARRLRHAQAHSQGRGRGLLELAGAWSHAALPIGVAASFVAGLVLMRAEPVAGVEAVAESAAETPATLFAAATGSVRSTQLLESAVGSTSPEAVLYQVVPQ